MKANGTAQIVVGENVDESLLSGDILFFYSYMATATRLMDERSESVSRGIASRVE